MPTLDNRCAGAKGVSGTLKKKKPGTNDNKTFAANVSTYYPWPLSPRPCTITTVDRCSVRAGNTTGAGILLNMAGRPTLEAIFLLLLLLMRRLMLACLARQSEGPLMLDKTRNIRSPSFLSSDKNGIYDFTCTSEGGRGGSGLRCQVLRVVT